MLSVGTNIGSLYAKAAASSAARGMDVAMERLVTGKRINTARDDAAGIAISSRMESNIRGLNQAVRNALDAQALLDTAEGGLQEVEEILQRLRELAVQAANDTNSADDGAALSKEVQSLLTEIDRISNTTTWAGQNLLDGSFVNKSFQIGSGRLESDQLKISVPNMSSTELRLSNKLTTPQKVKQEFQVNTYTTGKQGNSLFFGASIAALQNDNFAIAWESEGQDGSSYGVYGQIFTADGTKFGGEFQINTSTADTQIMPVLTPIANGGFIAAWRDRTHDGDWFGVFAQIFDAQGNKVGGEFQVNTTTYGNQFNPSISTLSNGNIVITWWDGAADGDQYGMFAQIVSENGSKIGSEFQINTYTNDSQRSGKVTNLEGGGFVVTWTSVGQDGESGGIYFQIFDEFSNKVGFETQVNTTASGSQDTPDIASLEGGGFVITWDSDGQDGDSKGIFGQRYDSLGRKLESEFQVNAQTVGSQEDSSVIGLRDGGFLTSWSSSSNHSDGSGYGIYGQRYDSNGRKVGEEFQINTYVSGDQEKVSLAQLNDGRIITSWTSENQDGDDDGIFAQILNVETRLNIPDISSIDSALYYLNATRTTLGGLSNRLDHTIANNTNITVNTQASLSRIIDADYALESTRLAKQQILQQASVAMLAQANASKQSILQLLEAR